MGRTRTWWGVTTGSGTSSTTICFRPLRRSCFMNPKTADRLSQDSRALLHSRSVGLDGINVGTRVSAATGRTLEPARRKQAVVPASAVIEVDEADILRTSHRVIALGPPAPANDDVVFEGVGGKAVVHDAFWSFSVVSERAILRTAARTYDLDSPGRGDAVGEGKIEHFVFRERPTHDEEYLWRKGGDVIHFHVVQRGFCHGDLGKGAEPFDRLANDVVNHDIVNAVTFPGFRSPPRARQTISDLQAAAHMADAAIADGNVGDDADRAYVGNLILGREKESEAALGESSPGIFEDVAFEQHTLGILQFKQVLDDERMPVRGTHKIGAAGHPFEGLEHVVVENLNVGGSLGGGVAAKKNALSGRLKEVIDDLVRSHGESAYATRNGLGVGAGATHGGAVKVGEKRIHYRHEATASQHDPAGGFVLGHSVDPHAVKDQVISRPLVTRLTLERNQVVDRRLGRFACDFEPDETIVVRAVRKNDGAAALEREHHSGHGLGG